MWQNGIDFNTDRSVILHYPQGAGGKFLINCLALGSNALFQDMPLAQQQLNNQLSTQQKLQMLLDRLTATNNQWNDLDMGDKNFFNVREYNYLVDHLDSKMHWKFYPVVKKSIDQNFYFFSAIHRSRVLANYLLVWPNSKIILFDNVQKFINCYRPISYKKVIQFWQQIQGDSWPTNPPKSVEELDHYPSQVVAEVNNMFPELYCYLPSTGIAQFNLQQEHKQTQQLIDNRNNVFRWDTDWYFSESDTIDNLIQLADRIGIENVDPDAVLVYYKKWITTLEQIKAHG